MDSVASWVMLWLLANIGVIFAIRKAIEEKREDREANDRFFREYERGRK